MLSIFYRQLYESPQLYLQHPSFSCRPGFPSAFFLTHFSPAERTGAEAFGCSYRHVLFNEAQDDRGSSLEGWSLILQPGAKRRNRNVFHSLMRASQWGLQQNLAYNQGSGRSSSLGQDGDWGGGSNVDTKNDYDFHVWV